MRYVAVTDRLEGWLEVPDKVNLRRFIWKKQYVVMSMRKILFFNSEPQENAIPILVIDIE